MPTFIFDVECLPNRALVRFRNIEDGFEWHIWRHEERAVERLQAFVEQPEGTFIGFNIDKYDKIIVAAWCAGRNEGELKRISDAVIVSELRPWEALRRYGLRLPQMDTLDLIEVAPSFVGLKMYAARMHMPILQDMPVPHDEDLPPEKEKLVFEYCGFDLDVTAELVNRLESELNLRVEMSKRYGVDMRSKSDAQMAEQAYISKLNLKRGESSVPDTIRFKAPPFISFHDEELEAFFQKTQEHVFRMNLNTGHVLLPDFLGKEAIGFQGGLYQLGVGGIHSQHDVKVCHVADEEFIIADIDVESFYPSLILLCEMYPDAIGPKFLTEYRRIYDERIAAKRAGDKATNETLKISLNGTFGKLASRWSVLYAPDLMLAVTLGGQFTLLMLIEWLSFVDVEILSANTDGIAVRFRRAEEERVKGVIAKFSERTGFRFDFTPYRVLAMKDVNNYLAIKADRKIKRKGIYAELSLKKNPTAEVCANAVGEWLAQGKPLLETVKNARFEDFLSARNVTGGGTQGDAWIGKVVRWYMSTDAELPPLKYAKNGNKVPKTDGARACMRITPGQAHPEDLDYTWYHREAVRIALDLGCERFLSAEDLATQPEPKKRRKAKKDE